MIRRDAIDYYVWLYTASRTIHWKTEPVKEQNQCSREEDSHCIRVWCDRPTTDLIWAHSRRPRQGKIPLRDKLLLSVREQWSGPQQSLWYLHIHEPNHAHNDYHIIHPTWTVSAGKFLVHNQTTSAESAPWEVAQTMLPGKPKEGEGCKQLQKQ